ncbi:MAG TPA: DUF1343 domain-containing protein [Gemmatimonadaceae bacterium]|nr:DUF1343 domain-containing protein [Gemmatimonadaceae bacterium]
MHRGESGGWFGSATRGAGYLAAACLVACVVTGGGRGADGAGERSAGDGRVEPGITVLMGDSLSLVRGKRIGLLTNQTGVDRQGESDIDLLTGDRARRAGVRLVALFSPEHGIRGTEDRENIASGVDAKTHLPIYSLYGRTVIAPPDSTLRGLDVLVLDLQDIGTRTWTYVGNLVYALRAAKRNGVRLVVLDRPNPLSGDAVDGPMLDSAISNANESTPARAALPYALYPFPLRHGMTMGELARFYNGELGIGADLTVVPMRRWRRRMWFDDTGLPWVRPSPNLPTLTSALVYPALVGFEGSNLSVGRGTPEAFQRFGAPWLDARRVAGMLNDRGLAGVRFERETFTPQQPGDGKFAGREIAGVRVVVTDRSRIHAGRVGAAILWAVAKVNGDSLRLDARAFDLRFGSPAAREALLRGEDPDAVVDRSLPDVVAFRDRARRYEIYR